MRGLNFFALTVAVAASIASAPVSAATFLFDFDGSTFNVDGTFTTNAADDILTATGTVTSTNPIYASGPFTFTGPGAGTAGSQDWSNTYDPIEKQFGGNGLGLLVGGDYASLYNGSEANYPCPGTCFSEDPPSNGALWNPGDEGNLTISAVPETGIWMMMLVGLFGLGGMLRWRREGSLLSA